MSDYMIWDDPPIARPPRWWQFRRKRAERRFRQRCEEIWREKVDRGEAASAAIGFVTDCTDTFHPHGEHWHWERSGGDR